jgi:hypothetical protein
MGVAKKDAPQWLSFGANSYVRRGQAWYPHEVATTILAREQYPVSVDRGDPKQEARLLSLIERWHQARRGREVIVKRGALERATEAWEVVFVEDDKGLVAVRASTYVEAMKRAIAAMGTAFERERP